MGGSSSKNGDRKKAAAQRDGQIRARIMARHARGGDPNGPLDLEGKPAVGWTFLKHAIHNHMLPDPDQPGCNVFGRSQAVQDAYDRAKSELAAADTKQDGSDGGAQWATIGDQILHKVFGFEPTVGPDDNLKRVHPPKESDGTMRWYVSVLTLQKWKRERGGERERGRPSSPLPPFTLMTFRSPKVIPVMKNSLFFFYKEHDSSLIVCACAYVCVCMCVCVCVCVCARAQ